MLQWPLACVGSRLVYIPFRLVWIWAKFLFFSCLTKLSVFSVLYCAERVPFGGAAKASCLSASPEPEQAELPPAFGVRARFCASTLPTSSLAEGGSEEPFGEVWRISVLPRARICCPRAWVQSHRHSIPLISPSFTWPEAARWIWHRGSVCCGCRRGRVHPCSPRKKFAEPQPGPPSACLTCPTQHPGTRDPTGMALS